MTFRELVKKYKERTDCGATDAEKQVRAMLDIMERTLKEGDPVSFPAMFKIVPVEYKPRDYICKLHGDESTRVERPGGIKLKLRLFSALKRKLNS